MANEQVKVLTREEREQNNKELQQLKEERQRIAKRTAELKKNKGVTFELKATKAGSVGFLLNGLGLPKFFYKQHAQALLGDNEEAQEMRNQIMDWIEENDAELTDKE
jgi:chorismate mutase